MVTSQVRHLPHDQGISVTPSGRLPSSPVMPSGSFLEGVLALPSALHMISLIILMSLLPTSAFSASKTVESSGGNSFTTVTQMAHIVSYQVAYQRRSVSPHRTGGDPMLQAEGPATNLQCVVLEKLADEPGQVHC